jgi:hypothetical protein
VNTTQNVAKVSAQILTAAVAKQNAAIRACVYDRTSALEQFSEVAGIVAQVAKELDQYSPAFEPQTEPKA